MAAVYKIEDRVNSIKELVMKLIYCDDYPEGLGYLAQINDELDMIRVETNTMEYKLRKVAELAEKKD